MTHRIAHEISGIPCQIEVMSYTNQRGDLRADNPDDYYGYIESEWQILDRTGFPALWLDRKLTQSDRDYIDNKVIDYMESLDD